MSRHDNLIGLDIHVPCAWEYANAAARTGASGFVAADVGKLAWQQDDNSIWILTAVAPTWVRVGYGYATTTTSGVVELATTAEANAGTDTTRAVVATGLLVRKTGTAIIGGDLTGDARGAEALDIQAARSAPTQVASGANATALGVNNTASSDYNTAVGYGNTVSDYYSGSAIGYSNTVGGFAASAVGWTNTASAGYSSAMGCYSEASGYGSYAVGYIATASGYYSVAIGHKAKARVDRTINICGPQINRKDDGEAFGAAFESFCGVEVILMSKEVDLKAVADQTLTLPANCKFWLDGIGCICTVWDTVTVQPTIRFGITGTLAKHHVAAITTDLTAAGKREIEVPLVPEDGETSLTAGVTVVATATEMKGRFYWAGLLIEDE